MPRRMGAALALAVAALAATAPAATAHAGNPNYRSVLRPGSPGVPGVRVQVLGYDNEFGLIDSGHKQVTIFGYDGEPYARLLPDGTVQVNRLSPALYLNEDRFATTKVPAFANSKAPPSWKFLDKTGRFDWHDHRMHWMAQTLPPQVKDKHRKTKVFDYQIPIQVGSQRTALRGTLFWAGQPAGFPIAALISLVLLAGLGIVTATVVRRRRGGGRETASTPPRPAKEAW
jgi:hypothetical protein